jgi:hypothetical protein
MTCRPEALDIEGPFTQESQPGRTFGEFGQWDFDLDGSWNVISRFGWIRSDLGGF